MYLIKNEFFNVRFYMKTNKTEDRTMLVPQIKIKCDLQQFSYISWFVVCSQQLPNEQHRAGFVILKRISHKNSAVS